MSETFLSYRERCTERINRALVENLGDFHSPFAAVDTRNYLSRLQQAITHSLLNGGKRVRPMLVYAAANAMGNSCNRSDLDKVACAAEMIHAYSLIHDDLPAMDDDDLRRGQPSCHRAFDEATAILAGDALQARAFELLTQLSSTDAETQLALIKNLTAAAGQTGMIGGQAMDLGAVEQNISLSHLETLHQLKTGALIRSAVAMGAIHAGANEPQRQALDQYAQAIGLSFQVQDDILDIESDTETLGKQQGADIALNKPTYPALLGLDQAKQKATDLHQQALQALTLFDQQAEPLRQLSAYIISRNH